MSPEYPSKPRQFQFLTRCHSPYRLIFMTYNGWVMVAVTLGAFLGYLVFGDDTPVTKETQCH